MVKKRKNRKKDKYSIPIIIYDTIGGNKYKFKVSKEYGDLKKIYIISVIINLLNSVMKMHGKKFYYIINIIVIVKILNIFEFIKY